LLDTNPKTGSFVRSGELSHNENRLDHRLAFVKF